MTHQDVLEEAKGSITDAANYLEQLADYYHQRWSVEIEVDERGRTWHDLETPNHQRFVAAEQAREQLITTLNNLEEFNAILNP